MVLGAIGGQGIANPEHRKAYKEAFLSLNQTEASKTISDFKTEITKLKTDVEETEQLRNTPKI